MWGAPAVQAQDAARPAAAMEPAAAAPGTAATPAGGPRAATAALESARKLFAEHRNDEALAAIDAGLKATPNDLQLRFERGVVLADSGRTDDAIEVFEALTQEFPELPEPHNNLAALYAARGELDRARAALEDAVRALPSYSLANENLGDIHLRLAERAYQRAVQADAGNRAARGKLALARELISKVSPTGNRPAVAPAPAAPAVPASRPPRSP
ncbi:MAG: hypothetical protein ABS56_10310 [Lautropia sp. SCN 69-89]|nr:MAG: hypothetical protein ABS56_10310 [Lautropia sp. SCN 69-89]